MKDNQASFESRIDAALRTETPAPLPSGFHARLKRRLHITAMLQKERRAFHNRMIRVAGITTLAFVTVLLAGAYWNVSEVLFWDTPGFLGYLDYLKSATHQLWMVPGNPTLLLSLVAVVVTLILSGACVGLFREPRHR
ncbi:MAG: hypothetical protein R6V12_14865 [Candidatus Hydrogenedentota bacterium]